MICPKCHHQRMPSDDPLIPDYQCPACGVIYDKITKNKSISINVAEPKSKSLSPAYKAGLFFIIFCVAISFAVFISNYWTTITAYLYWPIDKRPEITWENMGDDQKIKELREDQCNWAKREEIRHPGFLNHALKTSACQHVE